MYGDKLTINQYKYYCLGQQINPLFILYHKKKNHQHF